MKLISCNLPCDSIRLKNKFILDMITMSKKLGYTIHTDTAETIWNFYYLDWQGELTEEMFKNEILKLGSIRITNFEIGEDLDDEESL